MVLCSSGWKLPRTSSIHLYLYYLLRAKDGASQYRVCLVAVGWGGRVLQVTSICLGLVWRFPLRISAFQPLMTVAPLRSVSSTFGSLTLFFGYTFTENCKPQCNAVSLSWAPFLHDPPSCASFWTCRICTDSGSRLPPPALPVISLPQVTSEFLRVPSSIFYIFLLFPHHFPLLSNRFRAC